MVCWGSNNSGAVGVKFPHCYFVCLGYHPMLQSHHLHVEYALLLLCSIQIPLTYGLRIQ